MAILILNEGKNEPVPQIKSTCSLPTIVHFVKSPLRANTMSLTSNLYRSSSIDLSFDIYIMFLLDIVPLTIFAGFTIGTPLAVTLQSDLCTIEPKGPVENFAQMSSKVTSIPTPSAVQRDNAAYQKLNILHKAAARF